ncbi:hypothetical protein HDU76_013516 [Blyttiomyces sp. JEL0837]|nr:hypothetical protein HDU76_013516 [Blyttiomyces sp. JEL0837]
MNDDPSAPASTSMASTSHINQAESSMENGDGIEKKSERDQDHHPAPDYANVGHSDEDYKVDMGGFDERIGVIKVAYTAGLVLHGDDLNVVDEKVSTESPDVRDTRWGFFLEKYGAGLRLSHGMIWSWISSEVHGTMLSDFVSTPESQQRLVVVMVAKSLTIEKLKKGYFPQFVTFYY